MSYENAIELFTKIKSKHIINVKEFKTVARCGISGKSTGYFGKSWFLLPRGKALFKVLQWADYSNRFPAGNLFIVNELLCSALAKQISLPCAEYSLAYYDDCVGVVSYSLLQDGEETEDYMRSSFQRFVDALDEDIAGGTKIDREKTLDDVFKAIVFQLLTLQTDGKTDGYVFASKGSQMRFAGIVDNEYAFNVSTFQHVRCQNPAVEDIFGVFSDQQKVRVEDVIMDFNGKISSRYIPLTDPLRYKGTYATRVLEICQFAKADERRMAILQDILQHLDVDSACDQVQQLEGVEVNPQYKSYVKAIIEYGRAEFYKTLQSDDEQS